MMEFADSFGIYENIVGVDSTASVRSLLNRWNGTGLGGGCYTQADVGSRGNAALVMGQAAALVKTLSHQTTHIVGLRTSMSSPTGIGGNPLIELCNNDVILCSLRVEGDGSIKIQGWDSSNNPSITLVSTSPLVAANTWAYIEMSATISGTTNMSLSVELWVNGVSQGTGSGTIGRNSNTLISNTATFNRIFLLSAVASNGIQYVEDFYVNNGSGTTNTAPFGIVEIDAYPLPNADDSSFKNWIPLGGAGANFSEINENPADGNASYVSSQTIGAVDSYGWQDIPTFVGTIPSVQLTYFARSDAEGNRAFAGNVGAGGLEAQTSTYGLSYNYIYFHQAFDLDPATGLAWTRTGFNAKEFGLILVS